MLQNPEGVAWRRGDRWHNFLYHPFGGWEHCYFKSIKITPLQFYHHHQLLFWIFSYRFSPMTRLIRSGALVLNSVEMKKISVNQSAPEDAAIQRHILPRRTWSIVGD
ncbi:MAG: hypothetical protein U0X93_13540 [Anaerolineales bacterium]